MNLRERYDQLERRVLDLEDRLQRLDGRVVVGTGGVICDGAERFAPGSGRIVPFGDARPNGYTPDPHAGCGPECDHGFLHPNGPDGGAIPCPGGTR